MQKKIYHLRDYTKGEIHYFSNLKKAYALYTLIVPKTKQMSYSFIANKLRGDTEYTEHGYCLIERVFVK